jgi:predicted glycosyltransferase
MKIWYDACTGKHIRYGTAIARRLRKSGHDVVFTTREHPDTLPLARILGESPIVVGRYNPSSLFSRLEESASRVIEFSKLFKDDPPDMAISHQSVELCRTAFGLGIPIILTADTPHATAVNRLTIPFATTLVVSEAIPKHFLKNHCAFNVFQFKGVDEVAWIKGFQPLKTSDFEKPVIIVRQMETKASYAVKNTDLTADISKKLAPLGKVIFIRRYDKIGKEFGTKDEYVDSASIVAGADLVVSAGGTLAREAALQGVPSLVISELGQTYVNEYLAKKGFPLFMTNLKELVSCAKKHIGKRADVEVKIASLENPVDTIGKLVTEAQ